MKSHHSFTWVFMCYSLMASKLINNASVGKFVLLVLLVFICIAVGGPAEEVPVGRGFESSSFCFDPVISDLGT